MAFQKVTDTVEIDMIFTLNGVTAQNVFYALLPGGYNQTDIQALADAVDLAWPATIQPEQTNEVTYVRTEVRGLAVENDITAQQNLSTGIGTHAGSSYPNNVTFAIKKFSGLTGRSARGRTFWIGIPASQTQAADENLLIAAYAALIVADIDFIRATINGVGLWQAVLVSRFANKVKRTEGATFPWIGTTNIDLRVDTQRSRLPTP